MPLAASGRVHLSDAADAAHGFQSMTHDSDDAPRNGPTRLDLDETESWEILNGSRDGTDYDIPFGMIRSIRPDRWDSAMIVLRDGTIETLQAGADVYTALLQEGVIVRPLANYGMPNHLRVTVGLEEENRRFLAALGRVTT